MPDLCHPGTALCWCHDVGGRRCDVVFDLSVDHMPPAYVDGGAMRGPRPKKVHA